MPIKLLSWNVNRRTEGIAENLLKIEPHIAVIIETPKNIQPLKNRLSETEKGFNYFVSDNREKYVLICSKLPIRKNELIQIPQEIEGNIAISDFQGLVIIGLFVNGFSPCKENGRIKLGQKIIEFLRDVKKSQPNVEIIATGDFDCGYKCRNDYEKLKLLTQNGWVNTWHRDNEVEWVTLKQELKNGSFCRKNGTGKSIPDHLFATEKIAKRITKPTFLFEYLDIRLPNGVCLSDHAPLVAELEV